MNNTLNIVKYDIKKDIVIPISQKLQRTISTASGPIDAVELKEGDDILEIDGKFYAHAELGINNKWVQLNLRSDFVELNSPTFFEEDDTF
jgi:hypothetical protein